jgi:diacylglycerol kinase (ATP)
MHRQPKKLMFVINPISGGIDKEDVESQLNGFCTSNQVEMLVYRTAGEEDKPKILSLYEEQRPDAIIAVGGDGTVNMVGTTLINKDIPMGIIPMGSGNGLSKDLGIPQEFEAAMQVVLQFKVSAIDTLRINNIPSLHLSGLGFNALIVKRFSEGEKRGPGAYAWNLMKEYAGYEPKEYEIITDKESYKGKAFMVTIANANMFGSNATINPEGEVDDGIFEVCVIEEFPKVAGINILYQMYRANINESPYSHVFKSRHATIYNPGKETIQVDGEPVDTVEKLEVSILPKSLKIILP